MSLALRAGSLNRYVRRRVTASAVCFGIHALISLIVARVPIDPNLAGPLASVHTLLMIFGLVNLIVILAINPWRADRVPDRFPKILQDAIVIGLFASFAMLLVRREFLATTAAGALIVGLSLQDTLGNLFAGLAVQVEKPFQIGHWVNINGREGQVIEVTWRATKIRTKAGNLIVVPNNVLAKETITNYMVPTSAFRLELEVPASYGDRPNDVKKAIRAALADEPSIDHSHDIDVLITDFGSSGITYTVRVWATDFGADMLVLDAVRSRIFYAFDRAGIVIPYPTQVWVPGGQPARPAAVSRAETARALKATRFCATLDESQFDEVLAAARPVVHGAGEAIVTEGHTGSSMFVICSGEAEVRAGGRSAALAHLGAGDYFGEMSLLTGQPRSATVVALTDCRLLEIAASDFREAVQKNPAIIERVTDVMIRRRAELDEYRASVDPPAPAPEPPQTFVARVRQFLSLSFTP